MFSSADSEFIKSCIRNISDFPKAGIQFKDITTALKRPDVFALIVDMATNYYKGKSITKVVAVESRGFITGGALASRLGAGFVPVRKRGKLPAPTYSITYQLEYGKDTLEIHRDALEKNDVVLLHDDLLATGGTSMAVLNLIELFNIRSVYLNFIVELDYLSGRKRFESLHDVYSLVHF